MRIPKFMKWVFDGDHLGLWTCSKCGWFEDLEDFSDPRFPPGVYNDYYYCPRCGELLTAYEDCDGVEQTDLTTNLADIWPKYENSDRTPKFGDRVTLAKGRFEATGELTQIAFHVSKGGKGSDSFACELFASVDDEDWGKTTLRNPTLYLEEAQ